MFVAVLLLVVLVKVVAECGVGKGGDSGGCAGG